MPRLALVPKTAAPAVQPITARELLRQYDISYVRQIELVGNGREGFEMRIHAPSKTYLLTTIGERKTRRWKSADRAIGYIRANFGINDVVVQHIQKGPQK
ncbi:MAG: hypothetical protein LBG78_07080 [Azoarcus sp.]|jgi:cytidylate kinase|nr:hypothetical protein [Azoarcus sp.]